MKQTLEGKKELKDFLHLYLGCEGELRTKRTYGSPKITRQILTAGLLDRLYKLPSVLAFKPILRPLSDATDEESTEHAMFYYNEQYETGQQITLTHAKATQFLLSKHFDLFGLIEAGLAIDIKTLK